MRDLVLNLELLQYQLCLALSDLKLADLEENEHKRVWERQLSILVLFIYRLANS